MEVTYQIIFYDDAVRDIAFWKRSGDKQAVNKIDKILQALTENPYSPSPGQTETLKYARGYSRRINKKDRVTYDVNETTKEVLIFRMRGHYEDK